MGRLRFAGAAPLEPLDALANGEGGDDDGRDLG